MSMYPIDAKQVGFDLKGPCKDCPFKKDAPVHNGIIKDIINIIEAIDEKTMIHSCHRTDPRADGFIKGYTGKVQHCGGLLQMMAANVELCGRPQLDALQDGRWDPKLQKARLVFRSIRDMVGYYMKMCGDELERRKEKNETKSTDQRAARDKRKRQS